MKVLVPQSCPTLCNTMDCSPPVSSVHGILQARILEWVATPGDPLRQGNLPDPEIESTSPAFAGRFSTAEPPGNLSSFLPTAEHASPASQDSRTPGIRSLNITTSRFLSPAGRCFRDFSFTMCNIKGFNLNRKVKQTEVAKRK